MDKLPLIDSHKKPITSQTQHLSFHFIKPKLIYSFQKEDDKIKNNNNDNNYETVINYYTRKINNEKENLIYIIKRAICYLSKGYYNLALKDALNTIEIDPDFNKGYYIACLCYLEMYDIKSAEKLCEKKENNKKLKSLIEKNKRDLMLKTRKYKSYPLYIKFLNELYKYDSFFPKLKIHFYTNNYRGVLAKKNIIKNEIIMTIPKECLISLETVLETEYGKKIGEFMYKELYSPKHCLLTSFLLYEEKNPKYKYYFDLLPKDFSNFPIFYTKDELNLLKGSPFLNQISSKKDDIKYDYNKLCEHLSDFKQFSFLKFCQARILISSRIFGIQMKEKKTDVLVPFADLLNHKRPKQTQWYYDDNIESFVIQAIENIKEGNEIFDSYGKKTNARFLLHYGFCLDNNDISEFNMSITFNESYPLFEQKKIFFENEKEYKRTFNLNNSFYQSEILELLCFLRFILFDDEIYLLYNSISSNEDVNTDETNTIYYYIKPINIKLEIKVLKYFKFLCRKALGKYPTTFEEDENKFKNEKDISFNVRNILLLLMSEKTILSYYIYFCQYCLELFKLKDKNKIINKLSEDYEYIDTQFDFYIREIIIKLIDNE